ncbi:hypothetical protein EON66_07740 [archaeon]|nr:MAG: hypothetical protein EON66_07740 [archaeon]
MAASSEDLDTQLLALVGSEGGVADSMDVCAGLGMEHQALVGALKSLEAEAYVAMTPINKESWQLTEEALSYVAKGSPEKQLVLWLPEEGATDAELEGVWGKEFVAIAKGKCMKNKWIARDKATGKYTKQVCARMRALRAALGGTDWQTQ